MEGWARLQPPLRLAGDRRAGRWVVPLRPIVQHLRRRPATGLTVASLRPVDRLGGLGADRCKAACTRPGRVAPCRRRGPGPGEPASAGSADRQRDGGPRASRRGPRDAALRRVAPLVRSTHERFDGTGYPDALAGDAIPLGSRIITACSTLGGLVWGRPYRRAMTLDQALVELAAGSGTRFDPRVLRALLDEVQSSIPQAVAPHQTAT
ncbi:MAG TPA: HD domain-containing phosphohydrolase [Acidimicrobiales bacterium]